MIVFASVLLSFNGYRSNMCKKAIKKFRFIDFTCERMFGWFNPRGVLSDLTQRGHRDNLKDTLRANPYRDLSIFMVPLLSIFKLFRAIAPSVFIKLKWKIFDTILLSIFRYSSTSSSPKWAKNHSRIKFKSDFDMFRGTRCWMGRARRISDFGRVTWRVWGLCSKNWRKTEVENKRPRACNDWWLYL